MNNHHSITAKDVAVLIECSIKTAEKRIRAVKLEVCKSRAKPTFQQFYDFYGYELTT